MYAVLAEGESGLSLSLQKPYDPPPALVFGPIGDPKYSGESPIPLAGSGLQWPPQSVGPGDKIWSGARIPLACLWARLSSDDRIVGPAHSTLAAEEALARIAKSVLTSSGAEAGDTGSTGACVVIPNELTEAHQQCLLDALTRQQLRPLLLWRPIAAALDWLSRHSEQLAIDVREETPIGSLLTIHLGSEGLEGSWIELIQRPEDQYWILPARKRPTGSASAPKGGIDLLGKAVAFACRDGVRGLDENQAWRALWGSPLTRGVLAGGCGGVSSTNWGVPLDFEDRLGRCLKRLALGAIGVESQEGESGDWLSGLCDSRLGKPGTLGVIVTGDLAAFRVGGTTLGEAIVRSVIPGKPGIVEVEGHGGLESGVLARGANVYAQRRASGLSTYLDTLPKIEVLLEERARPVWTSLLLEDDKYVDGGRLWRRDPDLGGLKIPAFKEELALNVLVEPDKYVRRVKFTLPDPPRVDVPVALAVEMEPAGGHARVRLVPVEGYSLGRRDIVLDWERAERALGKDNSEQERKGAEDDYPRKCPQVQPRGSWEGAWNVVNVKLKRLLAEVLSRIELGSDAIELQLGEIRTILTAKPPNSDTGESGVRVLRVVNSDGKFHPKHQRVQESMDLFLRRLAMKQASELDKKGEQSNVLNSVLGYACAQGEAVDRLVQHVLEMDPGAIKGEHATLLAGCSQTSAQMTAFAELLLSRMETAWSGFNEVLKEVGNLFQWRDNAVDGIPADTCLRMIIQATNLISAGVGMEDFEGYPGALGGPRFKYIERNALVLIAFLLRKRITQDAFLAPDSENGIQTRKVLQFALRMIEEGKINPMGGMVDSKLLLSFVVDYINREGTGTIVAD